MAFHARAEFVWLPVSDEVTARRFLAENRVTHVVLLRSDRYAPYQDKWMRDGIPDARRIIDINLPAADERFQVYELQAQD
jgi:hypothetical protein